MIVADLIERLADGFDGDHLQQVLGGEGDGPARSSGGRSPDANNEVLQHEQSAWFRHNQWFQNALTSKAVPMAEYWRNCKGEYCQFVDDRIGHLKNLHILT